MLRRALLHRRARSLSALLALTVSAAIASALLTLYADLDGKLHHEFRSFGANIVVTADSLTPATLARARQAAGPEAALASFGYAVAMTDRGTPIVVAGVDFAQVRALDRWWQVSTWPSRPDQALLGVRAADFVGDTHTLGLSFEGRSVHVPVAGTVSTGADEDSRAYLPMAAFVALTGAAPGVLEIQVPGGMRQVDAALARLRAVLPGVRVEPVRQLVEGESGIVDKTRALLFGAALLIALTVGVSVLATLSAAVLERRRDFALMKALGAPDLHLMAQFTLETLAVAAAGIGLGWCVGSAVAYSIGMLNFHTATLPRLGVLPAVVAVNLLIALAAALFPVRSLASLRPALLLKGD